MKISNWLIKKLKTLAMTDIKYDFFQLHSNQILYAIASAMITPNSKNGF